jgi:hypothetical protein
MSRNRILPNSDYDIDRERGYNLIWQKTNSFHASLREKAESRSKGNAPSPDDVLAAETELNNELYHKLKRQQDGQPKQAWWKAPPRELLIAFGSGLIGAFLGPLIELLRQQQPIENFFWGYWIAMGVGIVMIAWTMVER